MRVRLEASSPCPSTVTRAEMSEVPLAEGQRALLLGEVEVMGGRILVFGEKEAES